MGDANNIHQWMQSIIKKSTTTEKAERHFLLTVINKISSWKVSKILKNYVGIRKNQNECKKINYKYQAAERGNNKQNYGN